MTYLAFCAYLNADKKFRRKSPLSEAIRFEKDQVRNFISPIRFKINVYHYNPIFIKKEIKSAIFTSITEPSKTIVFWKKGRLCTLWNRK